MKRTTGWHRLDRRAVYAATWLAAGLLLSGVALRFASIEAFAADATSNAPDTKAAAETPGKQNADQKPSRTTNDDERREVSEADQAAFRQREITSKMSELEERMFRLAESLRSIEPENSSRLRMGLKFARDELIRHEMQEVQDELKTVSLNQALDQQKVLLAKLERLQQLLLSTDLDFQARLQQLRQIRDILRRLDVAIKEEDREHRQSAEMAAADKQIAERRQQLATLEELIKRQTGHVERSKELDGMHSADDAATVAPVKELASEQKSTHDSTGRLAEAVRPPADAPKHLEQAASRMGSAAEQLSKSSLGDAMTPMNEALALLIKERERLNDQQKRDEAKLAAARFEAMRKDQLGNHQATDTITDLTRQLGDRGGSALSELARAGNSMGSAEASLGQRTAGPAASQQATAVASLKYAREQLLAEADKLLDELRAEVKRQVLDGLGLMLERQVAVRESTEHWRPKLAQGSRQAFTAVVALAKSERRISDVADELTALVEETEFGIALPAALRMVREQVNSVRDLLEKADGSQPTIAAEKQIEEDLKTLLEALKRLPSSDPGGGRGGRGNRDEERELNRLIAELKMIRMLQVHINVGTVRVDNERIGPDTLPAAIRKRIEDLQGGEEDLHDVTDRLASERGDEVP